MKHIALDSPLSVTEGLYVDTIGKTFGKRPVVKSVSLRAFVTNSSNKGVQGLL